MNEELIRMSWHESGRPRSIDDVVVVYSRDDLFCFTPCISIRNNDAYAFHFRRSRRADKGTKQGRMLQTTLNNHNVNSTLNEMTLHGTMQNRVSPRIWSPWKMRRCWMLVLTRGYIYVRFWSMTRNRASYI